MSILDRFKKHKITNENWEFYQSFDEKEHVVFNTIDLTYKDSEKQKGFKGELFIRIRLPESSTVHGIPTPEEHQFQNEKAEELYKKLIKKRINCIQVGRLTFGGQKQYIFEYNDLEGFQKEFEDWKNTFDTIYSLELNLLKPFEYYVDLLPDIYIWQQIGNRHVIEHMLAAGSDESKDHFIEHAIFGDQASLKALSKELIENDFTIISNDEDLLVVGINSLIDLDDITYQTDYLIEVSEKHKCEYDGWDTAIVK